MSKSILISGTSSGFGKAAAETLARRGYRVFATMRNLTGANAHAADSMRGLAKAEGLQLEILEMDVTDEASVDRAIQAALQSSAGLDVVINNAGYSTTGITEGYTIEQYQRLFDTTLFGAVRLNRAVLPSMRDRRSGLLIHVSSGAGRVVVPCLGPYCASKFALEALAEAYRFELAPYSIDSVVVEPGIHRTPIFNKIAEPADIEPVEQYGDHARYARTVRAVFDSTVEASDALESEEVVDCFAELIEMPYGMRPFRSIPTPAIQPLLANYNEAADQLRPIVAQIFGVPELCEQTAKHSATN